MGQQRDDDGVLPTLVQTGMPGDLVEGVKGRSQSTSALGCGVMCWASSHAMTGLSAGIVMCLLVSAH